MPDNRPINRPLDPNDDLLTERDEHDEAARGAAHEPPADDNDNPLPFGDEDAVADGQDHLAEQTDNSGEQLAEADDTPQGVDAVVDNDEDLDDEEEKIADEMAREVQPADHVGILDGPTDGE